MGKRSLVLGELGCGAQGAHVADARSTGREALVGGEFVIRGKQVRPSLRQSWNQLAASDPVASPNCGSLHAPR